MQKFHYLVRAVIRQGDLVLVARQIGANHTFLPGGHIEFGERAKAALAREISEEIGLSIEVGNFLGAVESTWRDSSELNAEVNLVFEASVAGHPVIADVKSYEPHLEFLWIPRTDVASYNLRPVSMRELVMSEPATATAFWGSNFDSA